VELLNFKIHFALINVCRERMDGVCIVGFPLTTAGRTAIKPQLAAILSVDGEVVCVLTKICLVVTRRRAIQKEKKRMGQREKEISKEK